MFSLLSLCSCVEEVPYVAVPQEIAVLAEEVVLARNGTSSFEFDVMPSDAVFNCHVFMQECQVKLEYAPGYGNNASTSVFYKLDRVSPVDGIPGRYKADVRDMGKNSDYKEKARLRITVQDAEGKYVTVYSQPFRISADKIPYFTTLSFLKESNPSTIYEDMTVNIASGSATVVSHLITSPLLAASFDSKGAKVYVDGVEQISGETVNDYSRPVVFTVKGKSEYSFVVEVMTSGLPVVFITTPGGKEIPSKWEDWMKGAEATIYDENWDASYSGATEIRGRGNSTWGYPKKPYALKLEDKSEVLGMPKHKRWVLLANWMDRTLLRNAVSFRLASMAGMAYTPRGCFVEVVLNGKHLGNYYLCEQIKVDENRVNIDELNEGEIDGGYLLELDSYYDEINKFHSAHRYLPYMFKDPDEVTSQQFEYIKGYVNNLEDALYDDARFAAGEYMDYIDVDSFADWWIVMELTGIWEPNHPKSTYMYKDKGGKLTMGPVWDFDWETYMPMNWFRSSDALYYGRLLQDQRFRDKVKERWGMFEDDFRTLPEFIREEAERIRISESVNHKMWPIYQYINHDENMSFDDAVNSMIKAYESKLEWMDKEFSRF